jgi:transcription elongation factor Elf1
MKKTPAYELRPGVTNPDLWDPKRPPKRKWKKIRKVVLERDAYTCQFCGHMAKNSMSVHHVDETGENKPDNLITCCVACHVVMHMGRNLSLHTIEIWKSEISQVLIVQVTREGVKNGKSLESIIKELPLKEGKYKPDSVEYANSLVATIGDNPRATLEKPLCAVFIDFKRWQIE